MSRPIPRKPAPPRRTQPGPSVPTRKPGQPSIGGRVGTNAKGTEDGYLYVAGVRDPTNRVAEFRSEGDVCPVCHSDRTFKPHLRLLVSPCYHKMCESCIDRLFTLGPEPCPRCGRILRKVNFAHQTFEDLKVEKEVAVRRRMAEHFNKRRPDFGSDREYDDYLEEVEDLSFNLLNDIEIPETEARISDFARRNVELIAVNQERAMLEALDQVEREEVEKRAKVERMRMVQEAERIELEEDEKVNQEIVDALAKSGYKLVAEIRKRAKRAKEAREEALAGSIPLSFAGLYKQSTAPTGPTVLHTPLSPSYSGAFVPIPYSDPDEAVWKGWYELRQDYVDGRSGVIWVKEDEEGKVRGGGYQLSMFWEMEVRSAVESLGVEPMEEVVLENGANEEYAMKQENGSNIKA